MKKFVSTLILACLYVSMMAQPAQRRTTTTTTTANRTAPTTNRTATTANRNTAAQTRTTTAASGTAAPVDRASLLFPTKEAMPEDVTWRRDIYRQLDLKQSKNSAMYYPVEPNGQQMNIFTCIFRLMLTGRINAYKFNLDGNESFAEKDKITDLVEFLNDKSIYYEEQNGRPVVADADVPSREVLRYYLKESTYLDQRTGTMATKVVALCPIMLEGYNDDFSTSSDDDEFSVSSDAMVTSKPLFWVKYDDVAPYLAKLPVMASDQNNVTNMTAADYFNMNRYDGKIYKTNNMQGRTLKDYCKTDSAMAKEQERIEKELKDFEEHLWGHVERNASADSVDVADNAGKSTQKTAKPQKTAKSVEKKTEEANNRRATKSESTASSAAPRVSARRERR